jgi:hypothetical protein
LALLLAVGLGELNDALQFDRMEAGRPGLYNALGLALFDAGRLEESRAQSFRARLAFYKTGKPYVETPPVNPR